MDPQPAPHPERQAGGEEGPRRDIDAGGSRLSGRPAGKGAGFAPAEN